MATINHLAILYRGKGTYAQAEQLFTKVLELRRRALGQEHLDTLSTMHSLAELYRRQGKHGQAEAVYAKILEIRRHVLGEEHPTL
jgi:tetratricopeptide (TPR) repeat protein